MNAKTQHEWHAEEYHLNSSAQSKAAMKVLKYAEFKGNEQVLDVGCGDGKITVKLANFLKNGAVHGVDASPKMIEFAQKTYQNPYNPNLRFSLQNATELNFNNEFDVIFSSFTLLWVLNQHLFLEGAHKSLKPMGSLIITTPLDFSVKLEASVEVTIMKPEWAPYFRAFYKSWNFVGMKEYTNLLKDHQFLPVRVEEVAQEEIFASRECLEKYIHQWFPYFSPLPDNLKEPFFQEVMSRYFVSEPLLQDGRAPFRFSRLDIVAKKASFSQRE